MAKSKLLPGRETRTKLIRTNARLVSAYAHLLLAMGKILVAGILFYFELEVLGGEFWVLDWMGKGLALWATLDLTRSLGHWYWWRSGINVLDENFTEPLDWIVRWWERRLSGLFNWSEKGFFNQVLAYPVIFLTMTATMIVTLIPFLLWEWAKDKSPRIYTEEEIRRIRKEQEERARRSNFNLGMVVVLMLLVTLYLLARYIGTGS